MLPGLRRQIVFRDADRQLIAEHDWLADPPTDAALRFILRHARPSDE